MKIGLVVRETKQAWDYSWDYEAIHKQGDYSLDLEERLGDYETTRETHETTHEPGGNTGK